MTVFVATRDAKRWFRAAARAAVIAGVFLCGCQVTPGPQRLEELLQSRDDGDAYGRIVFVANPSPQQPVAEKPSLGTLRQTLEYWSTRPEGPLGEAEPRWRDVLQPDRDDLYEDILERIDRGAESIELVAWRYDAMGLDVMSLVEYRDAGGNTIGYDHTAYLPPREPMDTSSEAVFDGLGPLDWTQFVVESPIFALIGLKELAGEIVKSPLSFLDVGLLGEGIAGFAPWSPKSLERGAGAFVEDWRNGFTALTWRFRHPCAHSPLDTCRDLLAALPIVGPFLDEQTPSPATRRGASRIVISQGINGGDAHEQLTTAWEKALQEKRPYQRVVMAPYRWGGLADVIWSLLGLSHGAAYDLAEQVLLDDRDLFSSQPLSFVAFSGGVQRAVAASRLLRRAGTRVERLVGVAGPTAGPSCAARSVLLLEVDPVRDPVVLAAHFVDAIYWLVPSNVERGAVPGSFGHYTPWFPDPLTRAPMRGYARAMRRALE